MYNVIGCCSSLQRRTSRSLLYAAHILILLSTVRIHAQEDRREEGGMMDVVVIGCGGYR